MEKHFNQLTPAEHERISLLMEECAESIQIIGKILRHGMESRHPDNMLGPNNREMLEKELGDVQCALDLMMMTGDVDAGRIEGHRMKKHDTVGRYLHHQGALHG